MIHAFFLSFWRLVTTTGLNCDSRHFPPRTYQVYSPSLSYIFSWFRTSFFFIISSSFLRPSSSPLSCYSFPFSHLSLGGGDKNVIRHTSGFPKAPLTLIGQQFTWVRPITGGVVETGRIIFRFLFFPPKIGVKFRASSEIIF